MVCPRCCREYGTVVYCYTCMADALERIKELESALMIFSNANNWTLIDGDHAGDTYLVWINVDDPRRIVRQALEGGE